MADEAGSTLVFGVGAQATIGIVQSMSRNKSAEVAEARDENGKVIAQKAYSKTEEVSIEALIQTGVTPPDAGTIITIDTVEYLVTASNITASNTEFNKVSITANKKDSAVLTAYPPAV